MDRNLMVKEKEEDNVIPFEKLAIVQPAVPPPIGIDWLSPFEIGTRFLVKAKAPQVQKIFLGEYEKIGRFEKAVIIYSNAEGQGEQTVIVDPIEFCKAYELFEVTKAGEKEPAGE
jgi:hypothetical protein